MAILLGSFLSLRSKHFLDERQELALSVSDLKNWNFSNNPLPSGFEVYLDSEDSWYIYNESNEVDELSGKFRKRDEKLSGDVDKVKDEVQKIKDELENIKDSIGDNTEDIQNNRLSGVADIYNDLLDKNNWIKEGKDYSYEGILVTVIKDLDPEKNGTYRLKTKDYTKEENWIRLLDDSQLVKSDNIDVISSDNSTYSTKRADEKFIDRESEQTITKEWKFNENIEFGDNGSGLIIDKENNNSTTLKVDKIDVKEFDIKASYNNFILNSSFDGNYDYTNMNEEVPINNRTLVYSSPTIFWKGEGSWYIIEDSESTTGYSVVLSDGISKLYQEITFPLEQGEPYILSYKAKGNITAEIDDNEISSTDDSYKTYRIRFNYTGTKPCIVMFSGEGRICEPKLSWGMTGTSWNPSSKDTDPVAKKFVNYDYLRTSFNEYPGNLSSGIILRDVINIGSTSDNVTTKLVGGVSGVSNSQDDVLFWAGGDYEDAQKMVSDFKENEKEFNSLKYSTGFAVTSKGDLISKNLIRTIESLKEEISTLKEELQNSITESENKQKLYYKKITSQSHSISGTDRVTFTIGDSLPIGSTFVFVDVGFTASRDSGLNQLARIPLTYSNVDGKIKFTGEADTDTGRFIIVTLDDGANEGYHQLEVTWVDFDKTVTTSGFIGVTGILYGKMTIEELS